MVEWLVSFFHSFPHVTFSFRHVKAVFHPGEIVYLESLGFWSAVCLVLGAVLLLAVIVVWSVRCCCRRSKDEAKRSTKIRELCNGLFIVSIFCFTWLGLSLFSNERINRGVSRTCDSLTDLSNDVKTSSIKLNSMNATLALNISRDLEHLTLLWKNETSFNKTEQDAMSVLLKNISMNLDEASNRTLELNISVSEFRSLQGAARFLSRVEYERWITLAVLLSIMIVVLFGGVVGFCRHSKKAAVLFSGLGLVIFILSWILFALSLGVSVGLGDYCADPEPFLIQRFRKNISREMVKFYLKCDENQPQLPKALHELDAKIKSNLDDMEKSAEEIVALIKSLLPDDKQIREAASAVKSGTKVVETNLMSFEDSFLCSSSMRSDYDEANNGLCYTAMSGAGLLLLGLLLLGLFLFILLILVSKAWHLYTKRPLDYHEVDDEDPFLPRGDRSNIPPDFYGTHVYNPRTRFASNADSEQGETSTPMWQTRGSAPPPAYDSVDNPGLLR